MNRVKTRGITFLIVFTALFAVENSYSAERRAAKKVKTTQSKSGKKTVGELLRGIETHAKDVQLKKQSSNLPQFESIKYKTVNLQEVKPPVSSNLYFEEGTNEAELEKVTDEGIDQLYKLTQQFKTSSRRGELWLRLAELYVEKARLIDYRIQQAYDVKLKDFQAGKTKDRPKLDLRAAQEYNRKAVQLYDWFLRDFPSDSKIDQALFFLGYNYFELSEPKKGQGYYERLTKEFPKSPYIDESNFALGEFNFENEKWSDALNNYLKVAQNQRSRLYSFALYKAAWCQYKTGQIKQSLISLERVIRAGRVAKGQSDESSGGVSKIRLATEAMKDLVIFYAEIGSAQSARAYFEKVAGEKNAYNLREKLGYYYSDTGNRDSARYIFKELINERPNAPKAYDYQYQLVTMFSSAGNDKVFREELYLWIEKYGPESLWAQTNRDNKELIGKAMQLIETALRNYILQQHQTAQNSRSPNSKKVAKSGYELYFQTFKESPKLDEMHFFYGELLFEMEEYEKAAVHYLWVADNAPKSTYFEKSNLNALLAIEKKLPTAQEVKKIVGDTNEPVEFDRTIKVFEKVGVRYVQTFPKSEDAVAIKYKIATLYYYYNQFDKALSMFDEILTEYPKTKYAEYSANLMLDIYNIRKDYEGLEKTGQRILSIPELAKSSVGNQIKGILQRASFKKAQDLEGSKDFVKSAVAYEEFAKKNANTELGTNAFFNAGVNYEKAGDLSKAAAMYGVVVASRDPKQEGLRKNASKFIAALYEKSGQYAKAAEAFENYANRNPKDKEAVDFYFNAAVIRDGMTSYSVALNNYQKYYDLSRGKDKVEALFLMGKIWEKKGSLSRAMGFYEKYLDGNPRNPAQVIETAFTIAQINEKMGRRKAADEWYTKTVAMQRRLASTNENVGVPYAAEAKFKLVYKNYEDLKAIRIPKNPSAQANAVQEKLSALNRLKEALKTVIKYDDGPQVAASLTLIGQAYQHMAASVLNAPVPGGLDAEGLKQYRAGIEQIARPFHDEAIKNYEAAIEKANKLEGYNQWVKTAAKELHALDPNKYPSAEDRVFLTKVPDWLNL